MGREDRAVREDRRDERGLRFEHPIHVDFLSVKEFQKQVSSDEEDLSGEDRAEIEQEAGMLRAVGLLEGKVDLFESSNKLAKVGTLGYYSYEDKRIRIRGEKLTPAIQSTLVHELTHALQDQHFDLSTRFKSLENGEDGASSAYRAIVEGDASRIEKAWGGGLRKKAGAALKRSQAAQIKKFKSAVIRHPGDPGDVHGGAVRPRRGRHHPGRPGGRGPAVNLLFAKPPTTDEHLLDPWTLIEDRQQPRSVKTPELAEDEEKFDAGTFGESTWLFMLAERLGPLRAIDAADGWGGDAYVAFERDGVSCVRVNYQGDTKRDLTEMQAALRSWIAEQPRGESDVHRTAAPWSSSRAIRAPAPPSAGMSRRTSSASCSSGPTSPRRWEAPPRPSSPGAPRTV